MGKRVFFTQAHDFDCAILFHVHPVVNVKLYLKLS